MYKVKKKVELKKAWGIIVILFLAMGFFSILGFYDKYYYGSDDKINKITGQATTNVFGPVTDLIGNLFTGLNDLTSVVFGSANKEFSFKIIISVLLFFILSHTLTKGKAKDVVGRYGNGVALLISLFTAFFLPVDIINFVVEGGFGWLVIIIVSSVGSYFLLRFLYKWEEHHRFASFIKAVLYLLFLVVIAAVPGLIKVSGFILEVITLAVGLISLYAIWMIGRSILRTAVGSQEDIKKDREFLQSRRERWEFGKEKAAFRGERGEYRENLQRVYRPSSKPSLKGPIKEIENEINWTLRLLSGLNTKDYSGWEALVARLNIINNLVKNLKVNINLGRLTRLVSNIQRINNYLKGGKPISPEVINFNVSECRSVLSEILSQL